MKSHQSWPLLPFTVELEKFKTCLRTCKTSMPGRGESDAEHSWHLAMVVMLLEDDFPNLNFYKVLKLALVHDLPEIYAGDINPYRDNVENKAQKELESAQQLFALLPEKQRLNMWQLFEEYENQKSEEARLVKRIDKLMLIPSPLNI
jgi:putative hydrolase of HD superfamily